MKECLLISEPPLQVLPSLARAIGLNEAIVLQQLHWLLKDERNGTLVNERRWIYNTIPEWREKFFPFWSEDTVMRIFQNLESMFLVDTCQPEGRESRRKYYRLNEGGISKLTTENFPDSSDTRKLSVSDSSENRKLSVSENRKLSASLYSTKNTQRTRTLSSSSASPSAPSATSSIISDVPRSTDGTSVPRSTHGTTETRTHARASQEEVKKFAAEIGLLESDGEYSYHHWETNGWTINGKPIKKWRSAMQAWKLGGYFPSQKNGRKVSVSEEDYLL